MNIDIENNIDKKIEDIKNEIEKIGERVAQDLAYEIRYEAQRNFDNFIPEVSADYPEVRVFVNKETSKSYEIECVGNQVLFIEFGTGVLNASYYQTSLKPSWSGYSDSYISKEIPSYGFKFVDDYLTEVAPRPTGIVNLGEYGKGQGMNDYWIYKGFRTSNTSEVFMKKPKKNLIITKGNRPARALYRAISTAIRRIIK